VIILKFRPSEMAFSAILGSPFEDFQTFNEELIPCKIYVSNAINLFPDLSVVRRKSFGL
jgi:hypothetical protein